MWNDLILAMPLLTVFAGMLVLVILQLTGEEKLPGIPWWICGIVLTVALVQEILLSRVLSTSFLSGAFYTDRFGHFLSMVFLLTAITVLVNLRYENWIPGVFAGSLLLSATGFSLVAAISNQWSLTALSTMGFYVSLSGLKMAGANSISGPEAVQGLVRRSVFFIIVGVLLGFMLQFSAGSLFLDEIERAVAKQTQEVQIFWVVEGLLTIFCVGLMGLFPWQGIVYSWKENWVVAIGSRIFFNTLGLGLFLKWGTHIFLRPAFEGDVLAPTILSEFPIFVRILSAVSLILTPLFMLRSTSIRQTLLAALSCPFALALFGISFGTRDVFALALGVIALTFLAASLVGSAMLKMEVGVDASLTELVGAGRYRPAKASGFLIGFAFLLGISPFSTGLLSTWTHRVSGVWSLVLVYYSFSCAWLLARWTALIFQRPDKTEEATFRKPDWTWRLWLGLQGIPLLLLGIFWKPLFKYGVFTVKSFFEQ